MEIVELSDEQVLQIEGQRVQFLAPEDYPKPCEPCKGVKVADSYYFMFELSEEELKQVLTSHVIVVGFHSGSVPVFSLQVVVENENPSIGFQNKDGNSSAQ